MRLYYKDDDSKLHSLTIERAFIRSDASSECLLSVHDMTRCGFDVRFDADAAYVIHPESSARCTINFTDGIYTLKKPFFPCTRIGEGLHRGGFGGPPGR